MGEMSVINRSGDLKVAWSADDKAEVEEAKRQFDGYKKKGWAVFRLDNHGREGDRMAEFDPKAEKILVVPPIVGG